ncbi:MAG: hypothetical protein AAFY91_17900 [Bacteroidota bacterium]
MRTITQIQHEVCHAHEQFQSVNARSTRYEYPGGDHYTPLYDYVTTTLDDFGDL